MTRRSPATAPADLPYDVRRGLVESVFADSRTMILGAVMTSLIGVLVATIARAWASLVMTVILVAVVGVRLHLIQLHKSRPQTNDPRDLRWLERTNTLATSAYLLCIGLLTMTAFVVSDNAFVLTLTTSTAVTHALSIAVRHFAIRDGVRLQISAVVVPLAAAFIFKGGMFPLLIPLLLVPLSFFIYGSAARLRDILLSEIAFRSETEKIAAQFSFAINHMSHGMCMISAEKRILVSNNRLSGFLGLPQDRPIVNVRFQSLLRLAHRRGTVPGEALERLLVALDSTTFQSGPCSMEFETSDESVFDVTLTPNSTGGWVMVVQDVTARRNAERVIDRMAHFDSVTNLRNRRSFEMVLAEALGATQVDGSRIDVMFLDLDNFKQVNDSLGHRTGDKLLAEIASRLRRIIGARDLVARWGGDEFVILHRNGPGQPDTSALASRIIEEIGRAVVIDGSEVIVGASIGSASAPDDGVTADALLSNADIALYAAKADGRRGWRAFEREMDTKIQVRRLIELELRVAVATDAIDVHFQPIVDVRTRKIVSFEALARWRHPVRGAVSPAEFIPIVEDIGLMEEFGAGVLRRACAACASWPEDVSVSVNLSPSQFRSGRIEAIIADALKAANLSPDRLDLEITESTLLDDRGDVRGTLDSLRGRGCRISLDDFGTGYSSLSYLLSFPLDRIKIDRSFTLGLGIQERASILVESVAAMSRKLGMSVLIEGVETERQMRVIEQLGTIAEVQGFLFSKPVAQSETSALVGRRMRRDFAAA